MLIPAILKKDEIVHKFQEKYYTEDMFYETGGLNNWLPNIEDCPSASQHQYAIINNKDEQKVIGYLSYYVDYVAMSASNFGLISFDKGNAIVGKDLYNKMQELLKTMHRIEWRMIGGNPVERSYDRFCNKYGGTKYVLHDACKDKDGNYRNDVIYEIIADVLTKKVEG